MATRKTHLLSGFVLFLMNTITLENIKFPILPKLRRVAAGLDAAFFHLYLPAEPNGKWRKADGETPEQLAALRKHFPTPRDAVAFIMDQFPIVKQKDEAAHGRYRTKERILEIYDAMLTAHRTGKAYESGLRPGPGERS